MAKQKIQSDLEVDGTVTAAPATASNHLVTKAQLDLKANLAGAAFTEIPTAPTAAAGTNTDELATTAFVLNNTNNNAILTTGNQTFTGFKSTVSSGSRVNGLRLQSTASSGSLVNNPVIDVLSNGSTSVGMFMNNTNGGIAQYIESYNGTALRINTFNSTGKGIVLTSDISATGNLLEFPLGKISSSGNLTSKKYNINLDGGSADSAGNATLSSGTITVNTTAATANSLIQLTLKTSGGTIGTINYTTAAGSFTITSSNSLDTSTITYLIIN